MVNEINDEVHNRANVTMAIFTVNLSGLFCLQMKKSKVSKHKKNYFSFAIENFSNERKTHREQRFV